MSNSKNDKARSGKSGRSSASSLTDAVVAALAQVEAQGDAKAEPAKAEPAKAEPAKAEPAKAEPAKAEPAKAEADAAKGDPEIQIEKSEEAATKESVAVSATVSVSAPVPDAKADAKGADAAKADAKNDAKNDAQNDTKTDTDEPRTTLDAPAEEAVAPDSSPTRPHAVAQVEKLVERQGLPEGLGARYYGRTDVGLVREHNEDNFLVADFNVNRRGVGNAILETSIAGRGCVFAVCDGMGGAAAGEVASQMAVDTVFDVMESGGVPRDRDEFARRLVHAIEEAGSRIFAAAKMDRSRRGMGTTSTVAGLVDSTLFVGQVGDSRAYVLRGDQFALITKDQSLVNQLIEAGQLTEEEAEAFEHSNIILQALGTTEEVTVDLTFLELRRGDRLLLCSDGLSGLVHGDMMKEVLQGSRDLVDAAQQLISMANAGGGHDNITVVLAEFDGTNLKEADPTARVAYQQYPLPPPPADDEEPAASPRATHMKSGGPKPGADVKKSLPSPAPKSGRPRAGKVDDAGGSPLIWIGLTAIIVLILMAVAWAISQGSSAPPPEPVGSLPVTPTVTPAREAPSSVHLSTDIVDGELWINGTRHGDLEDGMDLELAAGAYHLEARAGDARVADATFALAAGEHHEATLRMPTLAEDELAAPVVEVARTAVAAPTGEPADPALAGE